MGQTGATVDLDQVLSTFDAPTRAVLRFTTEVVREVRASEDALTELQEQGLSPREVVELLLVISYYMGVARMAETAGIEVDGPLGDDVAASALRNRRDR